MSRCYFCKGELVVKRIQHLHKWGTQFVLFENIKAEVCKQCGETYFPPEALELMDEKIAHLPKVRKTIPVPVIAL